MLPEYDSHLSPCRLRLGGLQGRGGRLRGGLGGLRLLSALVHCRRFLLQRLVLLRPFERVRLVRRENIPARPAPDGSPCKSHLQRGLQGVPTAPGALGTLRRDGRGYEEGMVSLSSNVQM
eukprot:971209-Prorocentrum_minimum.AAC.1